MIDKNGKIGGKINLIDFLIVIFVLAAIAFVVFRFFSFKKDDTEKAESDRVVIEFTCAEVNDYTVEQLEIGAPALDGYTDNDFGVLTDFKLDEAISYTYNDTGDTVAMVIPDSKSVVLTFECDATLDDNGFFINNSRYGIGYAMVVYAGPCKLWGKISGIDPA